MAAASDIHDPEPASGGRFGVAVDVGTSSVWSRLVELATARVIDTRVVPNPQQRYGADISSRLEHAVESPEVLADLNRLVVSALNESLQQLCAGAGFSPEEISRVAAVGNSAMYAFLISADPRPLCGTPYNLKGAKDFLGPARELGLKAPAATLFVPRPVFGFVGSDALADILLTGMAGGDGIELVIDVGTNCEMALGNRERILVASSPAGPAYEDTHVSFGLPASEGAIFRARLADGRFDYEVVGGGEPRGICGSGLIDIIAEMRQQGWVDAGGRLLKPGPIVISGDPPISVGQQDIRSFQLVKASVRAAISVLEQKLGGGPERMLITGTFGSYINLDNARTLRMFPDIPNRQVRVVADAACQGAALMLAEDQRAEEERIRSIIRHVALPQNKAFQDAFIDGMGI